MFYEPLASTLQCARGAAFRKRNVARRSLSAALQALLLYQPNEFDHHKLLHIAIPIRIGLPRLQGQFVDSDGQTLSRRLLQRQPIQLHRIPRECCVKH